MSRFRILDQTSRSHVEFRKDTSFMLTELGMDPNDVFCSNKLPSWKQLYHWAEKSQVHIY